MNNTLRRGILSFFVLQITATVFAQVNAKLQPTFIQINDPIDSKLIEKFKAENVEILHHYSDKVYLVSKPCTLGSNLSKQNLTALKPELPTCLTDENNLSADQQLDVEVILAFNEAVPFLEKHFQATNFEVAQKQFQDGVTISGSIALENIKELYRHPYILDIQITDSSVEPYSLKNNVALGTFALQNPNYGKGSLKGDGIVVGIGDGGSLSNHLDHGTSVLYSTDRYNQAWGDHPDLVAGIIGGNGTENTKYKGIAPNAKLVIENSSSIISKAPQYLEDYRMTITNNSYGPTFSCRSKGMYYFSASNIDKQTTLHPKLTHVFAAGNSGWQRCDTTGSDFSTIPAGGQVAKNSISVANVEMNRKKWKTSSVGPTADGRIKPDISAIGAQITSLKRNKGYGTVNGTSVSAPAVTGALALISERYVQLFETLPNGDLLKAILLNTAEDIGNKGPDFRFGFGLLNAPRAIEVLEAKNFITETIESSSKNRHELIIEENTEAISIMLYWHDLPQLDRNQSKVLVHDLDLRVIDENGQAFYPWVLNPKDPASPAKKGVDTLNNMEQVTIMLPKPGKYTLEVTTKELAKFKNQYVLTWDIHKPKVSMTYPVGGAPLTTNETTYISWQTSLANRNGDWRVEYNMDEGPWKTINTNLDETARFITFTPTKDGNYRFRVTNLTTGISDESKQASISIGRPTLTNATRICKDSVLISWKSVTKANKYDVFIYDGDKMQQIAEANDTFTVIYQHQTDTNFVFGLCARNIENKPGVISNAQIISIDTSGVTCVLPPDIIWGGFTGQLQDSVVELSYIINSHRNTAYFKLERQYAGEQNWETLEQIPLTSNVLNSFEYQTTDKPAKEKLMAKYRVAQIKTDSTINYSTLVQVLFPEKDVEEVVNTNEIVLSRIKNPLNPTTRFAFADQKPRVIQLSSLSGQVVFSHKLKQLEESITWPTYLQSGIYFLSVIDDTGVNTIKVLKQ